MKSIRKHKETVVSQFESWFSIAWVIFFFKLKNLIIHTFCFYRHLPFVFTSIRSRDIPFLIAACYNFTREIHFLKIWFFKRNLYHYRDISSNSRRKLTFSYYYFLIEVNDMMHNVIFIPLKVLVWRKRRIFWKNKCYFSI